MAVLDKSEHEISRDLQQELMRHAGKWVALSEDAIVGIGDTPGEALDQAREAGYSSAAPYRVPEGQRAFFF